MAAVKTKKDARRTCEAMRLDKVPRAKAIRKYCNERARVEGFQARMYEEPWHRWRLERGKELLELLLLLLRPRGAVLEVGCADGLLTQWLAERAFTVVALDIAKPCIERCRALGLENVEFFCGTLEEYVVSTGERAQEMGFDLAICWATLEHMLDPAAEMDMMRSGARWIMASVPINEAPNPDAFNLELALKPRKPADGTGHIWYFRPDTFRALFDEVVWYEDNGVNAFVIGR